MVVRRVYEFLSAVCDFGIIAAVYAIDRVIEVFLHQGVDGALDVTILIEGRCRINETDNEDDATDISSSDDDESRGETKDVASEPGSPSATADNDHLLPFVSNFYILTGKIAIDTVLQIDKAIHLSGLYKDQMPTKIMHLGESRQYIVIGTCGMLVRVEGAAPYSLYHINSDSFSSLEANNISHRADSVLIQLDYSYQAGCIGVADNRGVISIWKLYCEPHRLRAQSKESLRLAYPVMELSHRVHYLRFTPNGEKLIVGMIDRLYLIAIQNHSGRQQEIMIIEAILDM